MAEPEATHEGQGDNQGKIRELNTSIRSFYNAISTATTTEFETYCNDIYTDWVGEDEEAFEKKVSGALKTFLDNCALVVNETQKFIAGSGDAWVQWHQNLATQIDASYAGGAGTEAMEIELVAAPEEIQVQHSGGSYDEVNRGLQSDQATNNITTKTETLLQNINASINPEELSAEAAFIGTSQSSQINTLLLGISEHFGSMSDSIKTILTEDVQTIATGYTEQAEAIGSSAAEGEATIREASGETEGN